MSAIGVDGYSLNDMAWKDRRRHVDIMGYCYPTWVSDYTYRGWEQRTRIVSAFPSATAGTTVLAERSLQGFVGPGAAPSWGVVTGRLVPDTAAPVPGRRASIVLADGTRHEAAVEVRLLSDDRTREIAVALPDDAVAAMEVTVDGQRFVVPADALR
jgi:hypothetical protein